MTEHDHIPLREYIERLLIEHQRLHDVGHAAADRRLTDLLDAHQREHAASRQVLESNEEKLNLRLAAMNEIRQQLNEQAATFVRGDTVDARLRALSEKLDTVYATLDARRETLDTTITARLVALELAKANAEGRAAAWAVVVGLVSVGIAVLLHFI